MSNPYESPAASEPELRPNAKIWRRVWWPAAVLVAMCALQLLGPVLLVVGLGLLLRDAPQTGRMSYSEWFVRSLGTDFLWQLGGWMFGSVIILIGAWQALRLRSLAMARLSAVWACVPGLTPLFVAGIPFGVWLLVVLFQRETTAEFKRLAAAREAEKARR